MTAVAGVFFAFYYNNLFPEQVFHISRSIELILGADHRRHRHAVRADRRRVPAHRPVRRHDRTAACVRLRVPGAKQVFYGICLLVVVMVLPDGIWPWLARRFGRRSGAHERAASLSTACRSASAACVAVERRRPSGRAQGEIFAVIGPNGAGKTTLFNMIAGAFAPDAGTITFRRRAHRRPARRTRSAGAASAAPSRSCGRSRP